MKKKIEPQLFVHVCFSDVELGPNTLRLACVVNPHVLNTLTVAKLQQPEVNLLLISPSLLCICSIDNKWYCLPLASGVALETQEKEILCVN